MKLLQNLLITWQVLLTEAEGDVLLDFSDALELFESLGLLVLLVFSKEEMCTGFVMLFEGGKIL